MANIKKAVAVTTPERTGSFPVRFTPPEFRTAVVGVVLHYLRVAAMLTDEKAVWAITGAPGSGQGLSGPGCTADDLGLTYVHVGQFGFAQAMSRLYEYAFLGNWDESHGGMWHTGDYTSIAAIVADAKPTGSVVEEWEQHGIAIDTSSAENCSVVVELANARHILEGGECFIHGGQAGTLTIPQMALLAGMEEMSIRAAANPQRPNPLVTTKDGGTTIVAIEVAKAWLQAKGRYVPITRYWGDGEIDLTQRRFTDSDRLTDALNARRASLVDRQGTERINARLQELGLGLGQLGHDQTVLHIQDEQYRNEGLMRAVAAVLELPGDLLVLRAREALALQQLTQIELQLREATFKPAPVAN
jgi:hypothetical protein